MQYYFNYAYLSVNCDSINENHINQNHIRILITHSRTESVKVDFVALLADFH